MAASGNPDLPGALPRHFHRLCAGHAIAPHTAPSLFWASYHLKSCLRIHGPSCASHTTVKRPRYATRENEIDDFLRSKRGEFRLIPLPGGRTRLEGSTWYELDMGPSVYWKVFADALIHAIHERVLEHIASEAERGS